MRETAQRILIVGLDGATFDLLEPLCESGYMPNLKRLIDSGISARLESTIPPVTPPAWCSFMTGKNPGKHGVFDFRHYDPRTYSDSFVTFGDIRSKTIWKLLSEKGRRVCAINLPLLYPPPAVNGVVVSGFDCPSLKREFTFPGELKQEILKLIPDYNFALALWHELALTSDEEVRTFIRLVNRGFEQRTQLGLHFLRSEPWDLLMVHYQDLDFLQHKLWNQIEAALSDGGDGIGGEILGCYRRLDTLLGELLQEAEAHGYFKIILSDHGFGSGRCTVFPNRLLVNWGFLAQRRGQRPGRRGPLVRLARRVYRRVRLGRRGAGARVQAILSGSLADWDSAWRHGRITDELNIDWERTRAVVIQAELYGLVYVNLKGREQQGTVAPGPEYDELVQTLRRKFSEVRDPSTDEEVFSEVVPEAEAFRRAPDVIVPDLVLIPRDGYEVSRSIGGEDFVAANVRYGIHRKHGILIVNGAGVDSRALTRLPSIMDVAPTILYLMGLPVPADMDGRVLPELISPASHPVFEDGDRGAMEDSRPGLSAEDERVLAERLRRLGYLD